MSLTIAEPEKNIANKIADKEAVIGIIGLGYVGLPLAVEYAGKGFKTIGYDLDTRKVSALSDGISYIEDIDSSAIQNIRSSDMFRATSEFDSLTEADIIFICVPTPVTAHKDPDISYIRSASQAIARTLRRGQLIILKSTTYPDTTEGVVLPILEEEAEIKELSLGKDYFLAFSPERVDPGNKTFTTATTPIVVGGVTAECTKVAKKALEQIIEQVHPVSSPRVAEMEKLLENIFRSVNIALANEMAQLCDRMGGISFWEVVEAAATKPFGFMPFTPGPGLGGHCIPIDPYYLSWLARRYDFETSFITLSAHTNESMPFYVVEGILRAIADQPVRLSEARILLLGAAFKKNVSDIRHSPTLKIIELLKNRGVSNISYTDPWVPSLSERQGTTLIEMESVDLTREVLELSDIVVILTDHDDVDYQLVADHARLIVDTRNAMANLNTDPEKLMLLGGGDF